MYAIFSFSLLLEVCKVFTCHPTPTFFIISHLSSIFVDPDSPVSASSHKASTLGGLQQTYSFDAAITQESGP